MGQDEQNSIKDQREGCLYMTIKSLKLGDIDRSLSIIHTSFFNLKIKEEYKEEKNAYPFTA